jgi:tRNA A37 threonylcarbamoyladenosine synthetase subunit TsaC/SUA5/YrdC
MSVKIKLHPTTPHQKRIFEIADQLRSGATILFPTDTQYALGCDYENKRGI